MEVAISFFASLIIFNIKALKMLWGIQNVNGIKCHYFPTRKAQNIFSHIIHLQKWTVYDMQKLHASSVERGGKGSCSGGHGDVGGSGDGSCGSSCGG
jgi:hypothetical protein